MYETALKIYQHIDDKLGEAHTFTRLGDLIMWLGDLEEARSKYETALKIYQHIDEKLGEANTLWKLGDLAVQSGDLEEARPTYETALKIYQHIDDKLGEAHTLLRLSQWAALTEKIDYAETTLDKAFSLRREIEHLEGQADAHMVKALVFFKHHDIVKAKHELDCCSSIQDRIRAHFRAVQWLILYAVHLRLHGFKEGAKLCLEYAEEFASKTRNQHLQDQVKEQLDETM
jgi:tetratricopeptide (TPR) repeat protein